MQSLIICAIAFLHVVSSHHVPSGGMHQAPQKREHSDVKSERSQLHAKDASCMNQIGALINLSLLNNLNCGSDAGNAGVPYNQPFPDGPNQLLTPPLGPPFSYIAPINQLPPWQPNISGQPGNPCGGCSDIPFNGGFHDLGNSLANSFGNTPGSAAGAGNPPFPLNGMMFSKNHSKGDKEN